MHRLTWLPRLRREATATSPAFELGYVRRGPRSPHPVVLIPGGPGLASVVPYAGLRGRAAARGMDVLMVEHRGVGFSRTDTHGRDLPPAALWITEVLDDLAAVLDHEGVESAHIVGSSYGSYLAASFGVRHPDRVATMLLDSPLLSTGDLGLEREFVRDLFWRGVRPELAAVAAVVRELAGAGADQRQLLDVVRAGYELGGAPLLHGLLAGRGLTGRGLTERLLQAYGTREASLARLPGIYEFDLVGTIAFRELHYGPEPDGEPLDPALTYAPAADRFPPFAGEPFDLPGSVADFTWPLVLLTGQRDLRTPSAIARRTVAAAPDAVLVELDNGHSCLESHPLALLHAVDRLTSGDPRVLREEIGLMNRMPRRGLVARLPEVLDVSLRLDQVGPVGT